MTDPYLNGKFLSRFWACVESDLEVCLGRFILQPGWEFKDVGRVGKELKLSLIMNCAVVQGKHKDEMYALLTRLILDCAKGFWLHPKKGGGKGPSTSSSSLPFADPLVSLKDRIGGFYLTYALYMKQVIPYTVKIWMCLEDLKAMDKFFKEELGKCPDKGAVEQVHFIFDFLRVQGAFGICYGPAMMGVEPWRRTLANYEGSEVAQCFKEQRQIQCEVGASTTAQRLVEDSALYEQRKAEILKSLGTKHLISSYGKNAFYQNVGTVQHLLENDQTARGVATITGKTQAIAKTPVLTLENLLTDGSVNQKIMADYRHRLDKLRKQIMKGPYQPKREYVKAGGLWGKKKDKDEDEEGKEAERRQRRPRGEFSRNVEVYLKGLPFSYGASTSTAAGKEAGVGPSRVPTSISNQNGVGVQSGPRPSTSGYNSGSQIPHPSSSS